MHPTHDTTHAIHTTQLTKEFGGTTAVDRVDLTVERGDVFGFLGPNGAGKSTTIAMLLDRIRPTSGSAEIFGFDARTDHVEICRRVGVLPDGAELYDRLSGREHLTFAIRTAEADDDPGTLLDRVGLRGDGDRAVREYSTGMRQRLGLALALVGDPDLLLLDEPSSGLDPDGIAFLRELIADENAQGTTVFFSSHVLEQVEAVCDHVGILVDGQLAVSDDLEEIRSEISAESRLSIEVSETSPALLAAIEQISPVSDVDVEDPDSKDETVRVRVRFADPGTKARILRRVDEHTRLVDFEFDPGETSLEGIFDEYVHNREGKR